MKVTPSALGAFLNEEDTVVDNDIRIDIDRNRCHRYAICEQEAPEVFQLTADGRLEYEAMPNSDHRDAVLQAARVCPMQAIRIRGRTS